MGIASGPVSEMFHEGTFTVFTMVYYKPLTLLPGSGALILVPIIRIIHMQGSFLLHRTIMLRKALRSHLVKQESALITGDQAGTTTRLLLPGATHSKSGTF